MKIFTKKNVGMTSVFLFACLSLFSQVQISGVIHSTDGRTLPFVNVLLLSAADSALLKGEISEDDGSFVFTDIPANDYRLLLSMVGYAELYSEVLTLSTNQHLSLEPFTLLENVAQLDAVTVTARKPLYEQKIDRLVINVENSITSAGATALDVLERSPGVVVNRQNNSIALTGKNGVMVMINGKMNRMPLEAVVQMLAGMPSGNIEKIELITTPPANFDAEGNAGFINIVLKQSNDAGLNGSYSFSGGIGRGSTASAGINFNYRKNKLNLYGDYSFGRETQEQPFLLDSEILLNGNTLQTDTRSDRDPVQRNHNARLGLDTEQKNGAGPARIQLRQSLEHGRRQQHDHLHQRYTGYPAAHRQRRDQPLATPRRQLQPATYFPPR